VRESGDDDNAGTRPDRALKTFAAAMRRMSPGSTLYVGTGVYPERLAVTNIPGTASQPVRIIADRSGSITGDSPGAVIIDGDGGPVAAIVTSSPYVTIEGFTLRGVSPTEMASAVNLRVRGGSDHVTLQHNEILSSQDADGIRVDSSSDVLLFNNLVFSADRGIVVTGDARDVTLINNTVALRQRAGLSLRESGGQAPTNVTVSNCIFQENGAAAAIDARAAADGYSGDYNLVYQPALDDQLEAYSPASVRGENDQNTDALFIDIGGGDARLQVNSPAVDAGTSALDVDLQDALEERTTTDDGVADTPPLDIGYHFPILSVP
jgi:parallel beta-helix repeat protein